ncbi:hypothetical protein Mapa_011681 [Marchantia paleacea]|nr:hypothetical protein Mapa_011681 [Marchantia paleacea]
MILPSSTYRFLCLCPLKIILSPILTSSTPCLELQSRPFESNIPREINFFLISGINLT